MKKSQMANGKWQNANGKWQKLVVYHFEILFSR